MSGEHEPTASVGAADEPRTDACPLGDHEQRRNLLLFAVNTGMIYLSAPVLYVDITHTSLCKAMEIGDFGANLPKTFATGATFVPVLVAWFIPYVGALKKLLVTLFGTTAFMLALVAVILPLPLPKEVKFVALLTQVTISGFATITAIALL